MRKDRLRKDCCLQFYGSFRYNHKGSCYIYYKETDAEKQDAEEKLQEENAARKEQSNTAQILAKGALAEMNEHEKNIRYNTRTRAKQHVKKHDYVRGNRARGGIDGYRHREGALKTIVLGLTASKVKALSVIYFRMEHQYTRAGLHVVA
jgi:hypothetical protein